MDYKISDTAKKVTLGIASLGLIFLVIGFFQQKDFVYATNKRWNYDHVKEQHSAIGKMFLGPSSIIERLVSRIKYNQIQLEKN